MGKALENLVVSHTDIGLDTFEDKVDSYGYMDVAYGVMQVISWFIFLFGVINLINTTLSNQYSRRQENSVLRSIGLAPKQLAQMTVWEGMVYVVSSILLMLAIGTANYASGMEKIQYQCLRWTNPSLRISLVADGSICSRYL